MLAKWHIIHMQNKQEPQTSAIPSGDLSDVNKNLTTVSVTLAFKGTQILNLSSILMSALFNKITNIRILSIGPKTRRMRAQKTRIQFSGQYWFRRREGLETSGPKARGCLLIVTTPRSWLCHGKRHSSYSVHPLEASPPLLWLKTMPSRNMMWVCICLY